ncbi:hypothetical protein EJ03DRAFT_370416 [Teratosphaeria nubilosa]|uniref:Extracellular mutant protein 11 C-terminal domain-containing protein n=1 Tax=Teratosphaeria nubilosa TaxID=161662 RepID=A0A6G1LQ92_9PEZI|nr:hypothetical protein EJ03DRAFT_370416 [Teratosphaeria nubilosa]
MPPDGRLTQYVHKKNAADGTRPNAPSGQRHEGFNDLFMNNPSRPNSAAAVQQSQQSGQRHPRHNKQTRSAAQSRDPSQNRGAMYETDASDADKTSTAHSERRVSEQQQQQQHDVAQKHQEIPDEDDSADGSGDEFDRSEEQSADPSSRPSTNEITGHPDMHRQRVRVAFHKTQMKGDSYPSTTSGAPSHAPSAIAPPIVPTVQGGPIQNPAVAAFDLVDGISTEFRFGKPAPVQGKPALVQNAPSRPAKRPNGQAVQSAPAARQVESAANAGHQVPPNHAHGRSNGRASAQPKALVDRQRPVSPQVPLVQQDANHLRQTYKPQDDIQQEDARARSEAEYQRRDVNGFKTDQEDQAMGEEPDLDYDYDKLVFMKYENLRTADFDVDPRAQPFHVPDDLPAGTLHDKLASMHRFDPQTQAAFFATLHISEWEEAGDWFIEQFGQTLAKYKNARQEKRKAAKQFEDEIARRHEAVSKMRKVAEDALMDMRQSGNQVLLGTPKKGKKQR